MKDKLFDLRYELSSKNKSEDWDNEDIEKICNSLKNSKARDESGLVYELFKKPYAGPDIYQSLRKMFNLSKKELNIPDFFELMSITSLYKNKGSKSDLSNERGIFNLSKVRSIFDKVIYSGVYDEIDQNMSFSNVGGRKQRNIRDNLFTVYAAINDTINGKGVSFDLQGYDVIKCFDEMWYEETHNDLWNVNVQNDTFALISKLDEHCKIVVKTPCGATEQFELERIVLQGSVFGPIKCSVQMDTLGREALQSGVGLFKYKSTIDVPALAMIDDVLGMACCGDKSVELNAIINAKMETRKLRLSDDKCFKIHICKTSTKCTQVLKVHDLNMKTVSQATYLGDVLSETGTIDETVAQRGQKATGIISQISSMLGSISLGSFHYDIALVLREALFVNSVLSNSEVWHNVQVKHTEALEKSDLMILKNIVKGHSKTASEAFYLELSVIPLSYRLSIRRFLYLWHILHRDTSELIRKIYVAQLCHSSKGDWVKLVQEDKIKFKISESDEQISQMSKEKFRQIVKKKIETHAIKYLNTLAENHSKSEKIVNYQFKKREYFSDRRFSKEDIHILFALRTNMLDCKSNFQNQHEDDLSCRICKDSNVLEDEDHLLACKVLNDQKYSVQFDDVYKDVDKQYEVVQVFKKVMRKRKVYLEIFKSS